jgi:hypothetical protein
VSGLIKTLLGMRATLAAVPLMGTLLKDVEAPLLVEIGEVLRGGFFGGGLAWSPGGGGCVDRGRVHCAAV